MRELRDSLRSWEGEQEGHTWRRTFPLTKSWVRWVLEGECACCVGIVASSSSPSSSRFRQSLGADRAGFDGRQLRPEKTGVNCECYDTVSMAQACAIEKGWGCESWEA